MGSVRTRHEAACDFLDPLFRDLRDSHSRSVFSAFKTYCLIEIFWFLGSFSRSASVEQRIKILIKVGDFKILRREFYQTDTITREVGSI